MGLSTTYLVTTKNLEAFLNAVTTAQAPERFTTKFLQQLEFSSSNDRLFIGVIKALGLIDEDGVPKQRYFEFLDQTQSRRIMAQGIKEAYEDLFRINIQANTLSAEEVKNKLKTLTRGEKSDNVLNLMANTFRALCDWAEWDKPEKPAEKPTPVNVVPTKEVGPEKKESGQEGHTDGIVKLKTMGLHYNIQIHLPETRDSAVYDAIFKSLKDHLLH